jgi:hypothetical protein
MYKLNEHRIPFSFSFDISFFSFLIGFHACKGE